MNATFITNPIFFFPRPDIPVLEVVIPQHRKKWIIEMKKVRRYVFIGFPPVIQDNVYAHTMRVTKWAMRLPYISEKDREMITDMMMIHDVGEVGLPHDTTSPDKVQFKSVEKEQDDYEEKNVKKLLDDDDYDLWNIYQTAKPILEGERIVNNIHTNAILAKILDVAENETFFNSQFNHLRDIHRDNAFQMFPESTFNLTFPRLKKYRKSITALDLPEAHRKVIEELFAEIEAYGKISGQKQC